jgi:hypothetical protein
MARRGEEEDEIVAGTSFGAAGGTNTLGRASMLPQTLATSFAPDDLQADLNQQTSYGTKLFEVAILLTIVNNCKPVKDACDLLILRYSLLEELGPAYMWLIFLSVVDWPSLPDADKQQHTQMWLDWLSSYSKASEAVLQHSFWKLLKKKTKAFAPLHRVLTKIKPGSSNCGTVAWTEIFLLYPLTGAFIVHKLLARGLKTCLGFKDDFTADCTDYIASINTSVSQLGHMTNLSIPDVFAFVTLMGLYLSDAYGHQQAYKELLSHVDAGHALTLETVQHVIIRFSRSKSLSVFALRNGDTRCTHACARCCDRDRADEACNHRCPRCCDNRGRTPIPSRTSSRAGSLAESPDRRAYRNFSAKDLADLTEREHLWREQGITEETRVFAAMLYRNNVAPEQILLEAGCADFRDERTRSVIAEAAARVLREGYESTSDVDD